MINVFLLLAGTCVTRLIILFPKVIIMNIKLTLHWVNTDIELTLCLWQGDTCLSLTAHSHIIINEIVFKILLQCCSSTPEHKSQIS